MSETERMTAEELLKIPQMRKAVFVLDDEQIGRPSYDIVAEQLEEKGFMATVYQGGVEVGTVILGLDDGELTAAIYTRQDTDLGEDPTAIIVMDRSWHD